MLLLTEATAERLGVGPLMRIRHLQPDAAAWRIIAPVQRIYRPDHRPDMVNILLTASARPAVSGNYFFAGYGITDQL